MTQTTLVMYASLLPDLENGGWMAAELYPFPGPAMGSYMHAAFTIAAKSDESRVFLIQPLAKDRGYCLCAQIIGSEILRPSRPFLISAFLEVAAQMMGDIAQYRWFYANLAPIGSIWARRGSQSHTEEAGLAQAGECVYFVGIPDRRLVKIGYSKDVNSRLRDLRVGSPLPLTLLGTIPGTRQTEGDMHDRFLEYHSHGEWFHAKGFLAQYLDELAADKGILRETATRDADALLAQANAQRANQPTGERRSKP